MANFPSEESIEPILPHSVAGSAPCARHVRVWEATTHTIECDLPADVYSNSVVTGYGYVGMRGRL